ncbi:MAG: GntR family transcriptional regulator, partial [bacterium]|nr:GntR family transcriptional regulator [bacterium]
MSTMDMMIDRDQYTPLYIQLKLLIKDKIQKGEYLKDQPIPSCKDFAKTYSVSKLTVRQAFSDLIKEGILYGVVGKGTFVADRQKTQQPMTIGVLVIDTPNLFYSTIVSGVESVLYDAGVNMILGNTNNNPEKESDYLVKLVEQGVSGFILVPTTSRDITSDKIIKDFVSRRFPIVMVDRYIEGQDIDYIGIDHEKGAYDAASYLIKQGHRNIAYITEETCTSVNARIKGYLSALAEHGIPYNKDYVIHGDLRSEE